MEIEDIHIKLLETHRRNEDLTERLERKLSELMATIQDLNDAITALPQKVADSVIPLIPPAVTPPPPGSAIDTSTQIEALNQVPGQVSSLVAAAIAASAGTPPAPTPPPTDTTSTDNSSVDGSSTAGTPVGP